MSHVLPADIGDDAPPGERDVTVDLFTLKEHEIELLSAALRQLRSEGFGAKDIVIMAPFRDSAAKRASQSRGVSQLGSGIRGASDVLWARFKSSGAWKLWRHPHGCRGI